MKHGRYHCLVPQKCSMDVLDFTLSIAAEETHRYAMDQNDDASYQGEATAP